jgi:peptide/nickel transport system ATP-binding protein
VSFANSIEATRPSPAEQAILNVNDLRTTFRTARGEVRAVDGVTWTMQRGEIVALVGESGCGKSMTALSIMGLVPPPGRVNGEVRLEGRDLIGLPEAEMRRVRGNLISMIFQEPMTSLDPVMKVGKQLAEPLVLHRGLSRKEAWRRSVELLEHVRIADADRRAHAYPHQLSGGMRQRVMIAMALACSPAVLIADEPTTALDVTIQAQILNLILDLRDEFDTAILLITHDLGVVAQTADRVIVMYAGREVEAAPVADLFTRPRHPYTAGLMRSVPHLNRTREERRPRLLEMPGIVPTLDRTFIGCRFAPRCPLATDLCGVEDPPLESKAQEHLAACWHSDEVPELLDG